DEAYARAKQILSENIDELHLLAKGLLEHETLSGDEIRQVIRGEPVIRNRPDEPAPVGRGSVPSSGRASPRPGTPPGGLNPAPAPGT
ncbi:MAG: cell division protein FtsH, partial [Acetobacteraceae bacterium]|nr:cell division protein FtsH [Acetobacteraceae bacterium]